jgi:hypothetical protein
MYLCGEGLRYIIQENVGPPLHLKLQKEVFTISVNQIPEDADKETQDKILEKSQIITDTNNVIHQNNKELYKEYNKEFKQYNKEDGKVCSVIFGTINNKILTALKHKQMAKDYINHLK